jgi:hypothetical protein
VREGEIVEEKGKRHTQKREKGGGLERKRKEGKGERKRKRKKREKDTGRAYKRGKEREGGRMEGEEREPCLNTTLLLVSLAPHRFLTHLPVLCLTLKLCSAVYHVSWQVQPYFLMDTSTSFSPACPHILWAHPVLTSPAGLQQLLEAVPCSTEDEPRLAPNLAPKGLPQTHPQ